MVPGIIFVEEVHKMILKVFCKSDVPEPSGLQTDSPPTWPPGLSPMPRQEGEGRARWGELQEAVPKPRRGSWCHWWWVGCDHR